MSEEEEESNYVENMKVMFDLSKKLLDFIGEYEDQDERMKDVLYFMYKRTELFNSELSCHFVRKTKRQRKQEIINAEEYAKQTLKDIQNDIRKR